MESTLAIQLIPVSRIKANAENPRHVIAQGMVDNLAKSVQSAGLKNPIKVQRLKGKRKEERNFPRWRGRNGKR